MVENIRRKIRGKKEPGKRLKPQQQLLDMLWNSLRRMPRRTQVKGDGLAITVERRGISSRIALRHPSHHWLHDWSVKDHTGERDSSLRCRSQRSYSQGKWGWRCPGVPTQAPILITPKEPWVLITMKDQSFNFLLDAGASFCSLKPVIWFPPYPLLYWDEPSISM